MYVKSVDYDHSSVFNYGKTQAMLRLSMTAPKERLNFFLIFEMPQKIEMSEKLYLAVA